MFKVKCVTHTHRIHFSISSQKVLVPTLKYATAQSVIGKSQIKFQTFAQKFSINYCLNLKPGLNSLKIFSRTYYTT